MTKEEFEKRYRAVGEHIRCATLVDLDEDGELNLYDSPHYVENENFANNYWAIIELDEDGCYYDTVEDDFKSAQECLKRYKEMEQEKRKDGEAN